MAAVSSGGGTARRAKSRETGHQSLKRSLVLRDALAAELCLPLVEAASALRATENGLGALEATESHAWLRALRGSQTGTGDAQSLADLDAMVLRACRNAGFTPRYPQYLGLLLFAHWNLSRRRDGTAFVARLEVYRRNHAPDMPQFTADDIQAAAFWMATASGKTHVLHAALALLTEDESFGRIVLITPNEGLTRQHVAKLRATHMWRVFGYPMDGDAQALGRTPRNTVVVLDINKLRETARGDGVTLPVSDFAQGRNLVLVDEGHKGQSSATREAGTWKALQHDMAGLAAADPARRGLLIEFSATFGQVVKQEGTREAYAKSIVFDYAYDRFHADDYGKDFEHIAQRDQGSATDHVRRRTLTAALVTFWHQMALYRRRDVEETWRDRGLNIAAPLWVLLGLSVIGSKATKGDQEQTSDVLEVLAFLQEALSVEPGRDRLAERIAAILDPDTGGEMLPELVRAAVSGLDPATIAARVRHQVFGWQAGDTPVFRTIRSADGELGLGLLRGDRPHFYGVVNVGDVSGLSSAMKDKGFEVAADAVTKSLFRELDQDRGVNILIGSRRFAEGWDNYRASSLTLLRLGTGEGSLIMQMFGRVVRFAGRQNDGKRLATPPPELRPLQTAYIYGFRSDYLETFLRELHENGVGSIESATCPVTTPEPDSSTPLVQLQTPDAPLERFKVAATEAGWLAGLNKVRRSYGARTRHTRLTSDGISSEQSITMADLTQTFRQTCAPLVDLDRLYLDLTAWRRQQGLWNLSFDKAALAAALQSDRYEIEGLPETLEITDATALAQVQDMAVSICRALLQGLHQKARGRHGTAALVNSGCGVQPEIYYKERAVERA